MSDYIIPYSSYNNIVFPCNVHSKPEIMREWYED